jgi:Spy/CpxP family protein refolding chaperone
MKKIQIYVYFAMVFFLMTAVSGWAQEDLESEMMPYYGLNLTQEQIDKIQQMRLDFQREILELRTQLQGKYLELRNLYYKGESQETIDNSIAQIQKMSLELEQKYSDHLNQIRGLLTNEQKAMFDRWGGLGLGLGRWGGGLGMGYGYGYGYGPGFGRGFNRGWGRGFRPGWGGGWGQGPGMGMRMGMGYRCPWFYQGGFNRFNWLRNWR